MALNETNQRMQFGGFNWLSAFYGWLVAMAISALLTALLSAAGGAVALTRGVSTLTNNTPTVGLLSAIFLLVAMGVAYYAGGYVAGRMSRFDGGRQGLGVWVMGIVVALILAVAGVLLGANYNLLQQLNLPHIPVSQGALTAGGWVTLLLGLVVTLLSAISGAKMGERYHRLIDRAGEVEEPAVRPRYNEADYTDEPARGYSRRDAQMAFGERIPSRRERRNERLNRERTDEDQIDR